MSQITLQLNPGDKPPKAEGFYLTLAKEWVFDEPSKPSWKVRWFANDGIHRVDGG